MVVMTAMAQVSVEAHLDSTRILIGNQTGYIINITSAESSRVQMPKLQVRQEIVPGIEIISLTRDTTEDNGNRTIRSIYTLTSFEGGKYEIPSQTLKVDGKIFRTKAIPLIVDTLSNDSNTSKLYPMADVVDNPFSWWDWLPLMLMGSLVIIAIGVIIYYIHRLKSNKPILVMGKKERILTPYEKAMQQIFDIKSQQLNHKVDQKTYYTSLTDALRLYLEESFSINAKEMTSDQIVYRLSQQEDKSCIEELKKVFQIADLVKFAKYSVQDHENNIYMQRVIQYIERTKDISGIGQNESESVLMESSKKDIRWRRKIKMIIYVVAFITAIMLSYMVWQVAELIQ